LQQATALLVFLRNASAPYDRQSGRFPANQPHTSLINAVGGQGQLLEVVLALVVHLVGILQRLLPVDVLQGDVRVRVSRHVGQNARQRQMAPVLMYHEVL